MTHRSRLCHLIIDCIDLDEGEAFWAPALGAEIRPVADGSEHVYRRLVPPGAGIHVLLQRTDDLKSEKSTMHLDIETDNVEAEVARLEALGAQRLTNQTERDYNFWVMADPWGNEFCVLQPTYPAKLSQGNCWP